MKKVRVFAPASIANLGCGFDIMGLALDEVGDILEMSASEGDGIHIENRSGVPLPEDPEDEDPAFPFTPFTFSTPRRFAKAFLWIRTGE